VKAFFYLFNNLLACLHKYTKTHICKYIHTYTRTCPHRSKRTRTHKHTLIYKHTHIRVAEKCLQSKLRRVRATNQQTHATNQHSSNIYWARQQARANKEIQRKRFLNTFCHNLNMNVNLHSWVQHLQRTSASACKKSAWRPSSCSLLKAALSSNSLSLYSPACPKKMETCVFCFGPKLSGNVCQVRTTHIIHACVWHFIRAYDIHVCMRRCQWVCVCIFVYIDVYIAKNPACSRVKPANGVRGLRLKSNLQTTLLRPPCKCGTTWIDNSVSTPRTAPLNTAMASIPCVYGEGGRGRSLHACCLARRPWWAAKPLLQVNGKQFHNTLHGLAITAVLTL